MSFSGTQAKGKGDRPWNQGHKASGGGKAAQKLQRSKCHFRNVIYKLLLSQRRRRRVTERAFALFGNHGCCLVFQHSCLRDLSPVSTIHCPFPFLSFKAPAYEDLAARTRWSTTDTGNGSWLDWCLNAAEWGHTPRPQQGSSCHSKPSVAQYHRLACFPVLSVLTGLGR